MRALNLNEMGIVAGGMVGTDNWTGPGVPPLEVGATACGSNNCYGNENASSWSIADDGFRYTSQQRQTAVQYVTDCYDAIVNTGDFGCLLEKPREGASIRTATATIGVRG
jgi:hypothetical protein